MERITAERYARQLALPAIGPEGQERLASSRLVLAGEWELLRAPALYLAGAGVGTLLADRSNLNPLSHEVTPRNPEILLQPWGEDPVPSDSMTSSMALLARRQFSLSNLGPWTAWSRQSGVPLLLWDVERLRCLWPDGGGRGLINPFLSDEGAPISEPWQGLSLGILGMMAASESLLALLGRRPSSADGLWRFHPLESQWDFVPDSPRLAPATPPDPLPRPNPHPACQVSALRAPPAELFLDITGETCPMTYILARIKLAELPPGGILRILLVGAEPLENVPRALLEDGCQVSGPEPHGAAYLLTAIKA